jgi:hypothetical protein
MKTVSRIIQRELHNYLPFTIHDIFIRYNPMWYPMQYLDDVHALVFFRNKDEFTIRAKVNKESSGTTSVVIALHSTNHDTRATAIVGEQCVIKLHISQRGNGRLLIDPAATSIDAKVQWMEARFTLTCHDGTRAGWQTIAKDIAWTNTQSVLESHLHKAMRYFMHTCNLKRIPR